MQYNESEFFIETEVPHDEVITSRTDLDGNITYANDLFCEISGYSLDELLGKPHSIVRHPDMPKSVYKDLWETIKSGNQWIGIVKNLRKDRGHYWVKAIVSGVYKDGKLVEYKSLRSPIEYHDKLEYQKLYDKIRKDNGEKTRKVIYE
ncbi:MAG: chemotaxis protein [Sulfurimonas sp. RIFOXYC2_FULL_36_7]|uniref:PAS domain-containing protein n=1 Tax=Sulfurimonas sp. TaxID=2022749 RepID=UPI0008D06EA7|nr:PAS domain-containing protein [Sulfurimonas sp.]MDD3854219.1 PAS domain-containing protein [Sulfurimonas sp.]OHE11976.1 MAG: chemotaxis protein [Sulfurimonas sp. RIFOXYC2_FULL_36_7]